MNAPRTFRLVRSALASTQVATRFTTAPASATHEHHRPGHRRRREEAADASTAMTAPITARVRPLTAAERISARLSP